MFPEFVSKFSHYSSNYTDFRRPNIMAIMTGLFPFKIFQPRITSTLEFEKSFC